ncbi:MAG: HDOD domain-containing protein [Candidatus Cloacimonetes bacterium]|nr:HDOD domain-containing protein [Candidatus Cloacimonadota bacterium]
MFKKKILDKLERIDDLPTLLTIALEVERLVKDPNTSVEKIEYLIKNDPSLTAKVLKVANSATYSGTKRIMSLHQAITRLGFDEISKITLAITFLNTFKPKNIDYEQYWIHSITTGYIAVKLNQLSDDEIDADSVFTGGILHDIGVLILDQYFGDIYKKVFEIAGNKNLDLALIEQNVLGITHAEVGAILLQKWKLPLQITDIILNHHNPKNSISAQRDTKLVYIANFITNNRGYDNGTGFFPVHFYDDIWEDLNLSTNVIPKIIDEVENELEQARSFLRLGGR